MTARTYGLLIVSVVLLTWVGTAQAAIVWTVSDLDQVPGGRAAYGVPEFVDPALLDPRRAEDALGVASGSSFNLNDLLPEGSEWELLIGLSLPHPGQVAGMGRLGGEYHAFLLSIGGDADENGKVDSSDLRKWLMNYSPLGGMDVGFWNGDWDGNGKVDSADLRIWLRNYSPLGFELSLQVAGPPLNEPIAHGPEPASLVLFMASVAFTGRKVWRRMRRA